jgi:hypothetical protein
MATLADILGVKLPAHAGEDCVSLLPLLRGDDQPVREFASSHASNGLACLRKGSWKIIFGQKGGGYCGIGFQPVSLIHWRQCGRRPFRPALRPRH